MCLDSAKMLCPKDIGKNENTEFNNETGEQVQSGSNEISEKNHLQSGWRLWDLDDQIR